MTLPVKKYDHLNKYTGEIVSKYEGIRNKWTTSLDDAIRIGELLTQCRIKVEHGDWEDFVREKLPFAETTSRYFIRAYGRRKELKSAAAADLLDDGWREALDKMGEQSQKPQPVRKVTKDEEIEGEVVESPKQLTHTKAKVEEVDTSEAEITSFNVKKSLKATGFNWREAVKARVLKELDEEEKLILALDDSVDREGIDSPLEYYAHLKISLKIEWTRENLG
jgi:hypothetical protein